VWAQERCWKEKTKEIEESHEFRKRAIAGDTSENSPKSLSSGPVDYYPVLQPGKDYGCDYRPCSQAMDQEDEVYTG
jgi:hypothetical protein